MVGKVLITPRPSLEDVLVSGGDARIAISPQGMNKYGCFPAPHPDILSYSSCTASTISEAGFAAAGQLYQRSGPAIDDAAYTRECGRIQGEIISLCGLSLPGLDVIFSESGTDAHAFVAQSLCKENPSLLIIMTEVSETGGGVPDALHGSGAETIALQSRADNGDLRDADVIDAEAEALATRAIAAGKRVLLVLTDISKTGLTVPSPACALALKQRFTDNVDVLVDACQWRLSTATLRAYLKQDFLVAITGSKFVTGPAFSAALLLPKNRFHTPLGAVNYGLLLRWEAALAELRAFHALPEKTVQARIETFASTVQKRLADDNAFEPLPGRKIDRRPLISQPSWDQWPTIFPFRLRHPKSGALLNKAEASVIYERLKAARLYVGQPVACGALRLCIDMRLIARGNDAVVGDAMRVLDKAVTLLSTL